MPIVSLGQPSDMECSNYKVEEIESIKVYYADKLKIKQGFSYIRIRLKKFLVWGWIEIEGAQGIAVATGFGDLDCVSINK